MPSPPPSLVIRSGGEPIRDRRRTTGVNRELAHLSDEALVALAARSEQTALAELYDHHCFHMSEHHGTPLSMTPLPLL